MKYEEALKQLNKLEGINLFLISGEEHYLAQRYLKSLLARLNPNKDPDMLQELPSTVELQHLYQALDSAPFFTEKNIIYVENPKFLGANLDKQQEEKLHKYLMDIPSYNILIININGKLDKRKKISKIIEKHGMVVECEAITPWNVDKWLKEHIRELNLEFDPKAFMYFLEIIRAMENISLGFIHQELEKLSLLAKGQLITVELLRDNLASIPEVSSFRLWEALCDGKLIAGLRLYEIQLESGIHPLKMLGLLVRQVRQLWQVKIAVKSGKTKQQIAQELRLHPFIAEKIMAQANNFSLEQIELTMENLCEADVKLKTGQAEPGLMERIFIEFVKGKVY